jgi:hypothetical protein
VTGIVTMMTVGRETIANTGTGAAATGMMMMMMMTDGAKSAGAALAGEAAAHVSSCAAVKPGLGSSAIPGSR